MPSANLELHEHWMSKAIDLARVAETHGDRPFGALVVCELQVVSIAYGTGSDSNPLRHSECVAITEACRIRDGLLEGCALYSTHEPCHMCAGAILHSHVSEVIWGSSRPDLRDLFRVYEVTTLDILMDSSHPPRCWPGALRDECVSLFNGERSVV